MTRTLFIASIGFCLAFAACQTKDRTVFPQTDGAVVDGLTGKPAAAVTVAAIEAPLETTTNEDGTFSLPSFPYWLPYGSHVCNS